MELFYCRIPQGNFGDDLNLWLWPQLLPGAFRPQDAVRFIAIGSVLNRKMLEGRVPKECRKIVFGSGVRQPETAPTLDETWDVRFVRGPETAQALGLAPEFALTDSALCLRLLPLPPAPSDAAASSLSTDSEFGLMPHMSSVGLPWADICADTGFRYIDPRGSVPTIIAQIRGSAMLLTEAMHGAIVADAFRIPWHQIRCHAHRMEGPTAAFKWRDWRGSLDISPQWSTLPPVPGVYKRLPINPRQRLKALVAPPMTAWLKAKLRLLRHSRYYSLSAEDKLMRAIERLDREIINLRKHHS